jgi:hypothetical protein
MILFVVNHPGRLPLYAISDFANTARQLVGKIKSFRKYRELTKNLQHGFENPTIDECGIAGDCIICRDLLVGGTCKKLNCGHIYHADCLRNWLLMQQTCPTCRAEIVPIRPQVEAQPPVEHVANEEHGAAFAELREGQEEARRESEKTEISVSGRASSFRPSPHQQQLIEQAIAMREYYRQQIKFWKDELEGEDPGNPPANLEFD